MCDEGLTLGNLVWTLQTFFKRLGLYNLRFKPAYNPYTEPSMEIFSYRRAAARATHIWRPCTLTPNLSLIESVPAKRCLSSSLEQGQCA